MPLKKGKSQKVISANIKELYHANDEKPKGKKRKRDQIVAIAMIDILPRLKSRDSQRHQTPLASPFRRLVLL